MTSRRSAHWLLLLVVLPALAVGHGFAGAATHLPHHPDAALLTVAGSFEPPPAFGAGHQDDGHGGASCEIVTVHRKPLPAPVECGFGRSDPARDAVRPPVGHGTPARPPPRPCLSMLSVLRI